MAKDPIQELKEEYSKILPLFDELRTEINASRQSGAASKIKDIQEKLSSLHSKVGNDFRWVIPQEPQPKKKSWF
jgi:hypothetical protein